MSTPLDKHANYREKVCVVCYRKAKRKMNDREVNAVKDFLIEGYEFDNLDFPSGICNGCHLLLEKRRADENTVLPQVDSYDPERPKILRNSISPCSCIICAVARSNIQSSLSKK